VTLPAFAGSVEMLEGDLALGWLELSDPGALQALTVSAPQVATAASAR
jgi:hypothetical protein